MGRGGAGLKGGGAARSCQACTGRLVFALWLPPVPTKANRRPKLLGTDCSPGAFPCPLGRRRATSRSCHLQPGRQPCQPRPPCARRHLPRPRPLRHLPALRLPLRVSAPGDCRLEPHSGANGQQRQTPRGCAVHASVHACVCCVHIYVHLCNPSTPWGNSLARG